jgi:hypothetical protein
MDRKLQWALLILMTAAPWLFLAGMYLFFSLDYPRLDQWEFVPFLEKALASRLGFMDFWQQHNEHRPVFPRLLMLILARPSHWNMFLETAVSFLAGTLVFCILAWRLWIHARRKKILPWLWIPLSILCFSMVQWQNWFLGWQLSLMMNLLLTVLVFLILAAAPVLSGAFPLAILLTVIAVFSFANGMLIWLIGIPVIYMARPLAAWRQIRWCGIWLIAATLTAVVYMYGYHAPAWHPSPISFLWHPIAFPLYILVYLGQPVCAFNTAGAGAAGFLGLLAWGLLLYRRARNPETVYTNRQLAFALGLYAIGSAVLTATARVELGGVIQAMSPRYATFGNLLWFALFLLAPRPLAIRGRTFIPRAAAVAAVVLLAGGSSLYGAYRWTERYHVYSGIEEEVRHGTDELAIRWIYPNPDLLIERRAILKKYGLAGFDREDRNSQERGE